MKKAPLKAGDHWVPKAGGLGGFTVTSVAGNDIEVEVIRVLGRDKETGEVKLQPRTRRFSTWNDFRDFALGYEQE